MPFVHTVTPVFVIYSFVAIYRLIACHFPLSPKLVIQAFIWKTEQFHSNRTTSIDIDTGERHLKRTNNPIPFTTVNDRINTKPLCTKSVVNVLNRICDSIILRKFNSEQQVKYLRFAVWNGQVILTQYISHSAMRPVQCCIPVAHFGLSTNYIPEQHNRMLIC